MALGVEPVLFNRDVRPILSENCFECHGPDAAKRKADLRLDAGELGLALIVAGKPGESEFYQRIVHADPDERMPPPDSGHALSAVEVETLRRWIEQGALWEKHWAFIVPKRPAVPASHGSPWPRGAIDRFILAKLRESGLRPSPEADRETLLRRVTFDLTGLPPSRRKSTRFWRTPRLAHTRWWSTGCWLRRGTASGWRSIGSTPRAMPIRTGTASIAVA